MYSGLSEREDKGGTDSVTEQCDQVWEEIQQIQTQIQTQI